MGTGTVVAWCFGRDEVCWWELALLLRVNGDALLHEAVIRDGMVTVLPVGWAVAEAPVGNGSLSAARAVRRVEIAAFAEAGAERAWVEPEELAVIVFLVEVAFQGQALAEPGVRVLAGFQGQVLAEPAASAASGFLELAEAAVVASA